MVNALQPDISALVDGLLDRIAESGRFDVVADFAYPLPVAVICRLLGVPLEDEPQFSRASALLAQALDPFVTFTGAPSEGMNDAYRPVRGCVNTCTALIERRRSRPGDDLMSGLIAVEESGDQLTEDEIVSTCVLLLVAGHETTVNLIANAILAMLRHPWAVGRAGRRRHPCLGGHRGNPALRPAGAAGRPNCLADDMTIAGIDVAKGDVMMLLLAAAQRDPAEFERPDDFDPDRGTLRHLGFGRGAHYCLGAPLARLEASVALSAVTTRFPTRAWTASRSTRRMSRCAGCRR